MEYNYPFREDRRKDLANAACRFPPRPNQDYYTETHNWGPRVARPQRPIRSLQRTQLGAFSSEERLPTHRNFFKRKASGSPVTLKQHLKNRQAKQANINALMKVRDQRFIATNTPKHQGPLRMQTQPHPQWQPSPTKPKQHGRKRRQQLGKQKEQSIKRNLEMKALEAYKTELDTMRNRAINQIQKRRIDQGSVRRPRTNGRNILQVRKAKLLEATAAEEIRRDRQSKIICPYSSGTKNPPDTPRIAVEEVPPQSPSTSPTNNFDRLVSFKQSSLSSMKGGDALIVPQIPSNQPPQVKRTVVVEQQVIPTFGNIPNEQPLPKQKSVIRNDGTTNQFTSPVNIQLAKPVIQPSAEDNFDQNNPYQYPKSDSASNSGSSKSLKLQSTISRKAIRRVGGRSRISSKIINISTIRNSKISHNPEFDEMIEKMELHIEVINRIAEYVEESSNLYDNTVWRCENFMMYKRYYMERVRVQETLNGYRNCFTLNEVEIKKEVLQKYLKAPEVRALAEQVNHHNSEVRTCLESLHASLRIRTGNHPTLNILFDRLSITRLHHDIINAFSREFTALKKLYTTEEDQERRAAVEQRLIDIIQLTYLLEELSDNFVRSFVECQDIESFEEFLLTNQPVFAKIAKKYNRPS